MTESIAKISNRELKDLYQGLERSQQYFADSAEEGCDVALLFKGYADRVLKDKALANPLLGFTTYTWIKGPRKRNGVNEFSIIGRGGEFEGTFLKVTRVVKDNITWSKPHSLGLARELHAIVSERIKYREPICNSTKVALGDAIKTLIGMGKYLISFKVDKGIHLVFKAGVRNGNCIEVYIGGWFDEIQFPLTNYEKVKVVNPLRQTQEGYKEYYHGPNKYAYTYPASS